MTTRVFVSDDNDLFVIFNDMGLSQQDKEYIAYLLLSHRSFDAFVRNYHNTAGYYHTYLHGGMVHRCMPMEILIYKNNSNIEISSQDMEEPLDSVFPRHCRINMEIVNPMVASEILASTIHSSRVPVEVCRVHKKSEWETFIVEQFRDIV